MSECAQRSFAVRRQGDRQESVGERSWRVKPESSKGLRLPALPRVRNTPRTNQIPQRTQGLPNLRLWSNEFLPIQSTCHHHEKRFGIRTPEKYSFRENCPQQGVTDGVLMRNSFTHWRRKWRVEKRKLFHWPPSHLKKHSAERKSEIQRISVDFQQAKIIPRSIYVDKAYLASLFNKLISSESSLGEIFYCKLQRKNPKWRKENLTGFDKKRSPSKTLVRICSFPY